MMWLTILYAALAGGAGAALRYIVDHVVMRGRKDAFPLGILIVNVSGSLVLGLLTGLAAVIGGTALAIVGIGLLGGFTTFSTVSVESVLLAHRGRRNWAWVNLVGTLALALVAAGLGLAIGRLFVG